MSEAAVVEDAIVECGRALGCHGCFQWELTNVKSNTIKNCTLPRELYHMHVVDSCSRTIRS